MRTKLDKQSIANSFRKQKQKGVGDLFAALLREFGSLGNSVVGGIAESLLNTAPPKDGNNRISSLTLLATVATSLIAVAAVAIVLSRREGVSDGDDDVVPAVNNKPKGIPPTSEGSMELIIDEVRAKMRTSIAITALNERTLVRERECVLR